MIVNIIIIIILIFPFQATPSDADLSAAPDRVTLNWNVNVFPSSHLISDLESFSSYSVRVACQNSQGTSSWTPWVTLQTTEGGSCSPAVCD